MADITMTTTAGRETVVEEATVAAFSSRLRGQLLRPGHNGYEDTRKVWNGMIDKRPALIVRCAGVRDVVDAVRFAREHDLLGSVRGGGHNIAGKAVCDGGLMIDLSGMRSVQVDPVKRTARVEGGALLGDLDREAQVYGLATTAGVVTHTGVGGLTLGGGVGRLARKHGLACDNLLAVEVVTAAGDVLRASATENADLFWGVRGGGTSASSPPSSSSFIRWARECWEAKWCITLSKLKRPSSSITSTPERLPTSSPPMGSS